MAELTTDQQRALAIASAKLKLQGQNIGPTIDAARQQEMERLQTGVTGERVPGIERQFTAEAQAAGAPPGMVFDSRTGQMVDTAAAAERMGGGQQAAATALMAIPGVGEFIDNLFGQARQAQTGENPDIAASTTRQAREQFREAHPIGAPALEFGSSLAATLPAAAAIGGGSLLANTGRSLGQRVGIGAGVGAGAGAIEGGLSGAGRADLGGRLEGAKEGATIGALFGGALGAAGTLTSAGLSSAWKRIKSGAAPKPPTTAGLQAAKTNAYRAVDSSGFVIPANDFDGMLTQTYRALDGLDYNPDTDTQIKAVVRALENKFGDDMTLGTLDKLRQLAWRRVKNSDDQQRALASSIVAQIDNLIDNVGAGDAMDTARSANARWRKALAFEDAWERAERQTAATGSGGNILNKARQAINRIIDGNDSRFFSAGELDLMKTYVEGDTLENVLRRMGKLAPGGNGLMSALNLGAVAVNPAMLAVTAGATGAKALADKSAQRGFTALRDAVATGVLPAARTSTALTAPTAAALGATASATGQQQGPTTAKERGIELFNSGVTDPAEIRAVLQSEGFL